MLDWIVRVAQVFHLPWAQWFSVDPSLHPGVASYVLLAALVAVEGPLATLLGAAAAGMGILDPRHVFLSAVVGNLTADSLWYLLGYLGRVEWLHRYGRWLGVKPHHVERLTQEVRAHAVKILLVAKLTAGLVIPSLVAAGLSRVAWRRWFPPVFLAEMIWTGGLVWIGMRATEAIAQVERGLEVLGILGAGVILGLLVFYLRRHRHSAAE